MFYTRPITCMNTYTLRGTALYCVLFSLWVLSHALALPGTLYTPGARHTDNALKDPRSTSAQEKCGIPLEAVKAHVKLSLKNSWIATHDEGAHRSFISKKPTNLRRTKALGRLDEVLLHQ